MLRKSAALAVIAALFAAGPANAGLIAGATKATRMEERGVAVYRGAASSDVVERELAGGEKPRRARKRIVVHARKGAVDNRCWPVRTLRVQGFSYGTNTGGGPARRRYTQGFFADRMAAGY